MNARPHSALLTILVVLIELAWAFNSIAAKIGLVHLGPLGLASFRIVLSGLVFIPIFLLAPRPVKIEWSDLPTFALLGLLVVAINQGCFTIGLDYTTVGHSALIIGMGPIFVLLLARAMRLETLTPAKLAGMAISFAGVLILATENGLHLRSGTLRGDLITIVGTSCFALYTVLGKRVVEKYDTVAMNTFCHLAGAVVWFPVAVWKGSRLDWGWVAWQGWAALAYMALFGSVGAYLVFYWALNHMAASRLAAFGYLMPVLATLLGVVLLGEVLTARFLVGGALILAGVYLSQRGPRAAQIPVKVISQ